MIMQLSRGIFGKIVAWRVKRARARRAAEILDQLPADMGYGGEDEEATSSYPRRFAPQTEGSCYRVT